MLQKGIGKISLFGYDPFATDVANAMRWRTVRVVDVLITADGRTLTEIAEECLKLPGGDGLTRPVLSDYLRATYEPDPETGKKKGRPINLRHLAVLAKVLKSDPNTLMLDVPAESAIEAVTDVAKAAAYTAPKEVKEDTRILHLRSITRPVKPLLPANFDHNMGTAPVYLAAAGRPLLVGDAVDTAPVPTKFMSKHDDNNFYVLVRGYSMIHSQIDDGDLVFCRKDKVAKTGSIVAATVDGDGVLKILDIREDGSRWLISDTDLLEDYSEYEVKDGVEIHAVAIFVLKSLEKRTKYRV